MSGAHEVRPPRIGFGLILQSFLFVASNWPRATQVIGPWLVVFAIAIYGLALGFDQISEGDESPLLSLAILGVLVAFPLACAWIAIAWHRTVLRGGPQTLFSISFGDVLRYTAATSIAVLATALPFVAPAFVGWTLPTGGMTAIVFVGIADALIAVTVLAIFLRFSFMLPALALGDAQMSSRRSWQETKPVWRALLRGTLVIIPLGIATLVYATGFLDYAHGPTTQTLNAMLKVAVAFVTILIYATYLSLVYARTVASAERLSSAFD
jgi:hypothetical protein